MSEEKSFHGSISKALVAPSALPGRKLVDCPSLFNYLFRVVESAGSTIGPALRGAILVLTLGFYGAVGLVCGGLYVVCAMLRFFWTKEPDRK